MGLWAWADQWKERWMRREWSSAFSISELPRLDIPFAVLSACQISDPQLPIQRASNKIPLNISCYNIMHKHDVKCERYLKISERELHFPHLGREREARDCKKPKHPWLWLLHYQDTYAVTSILKHAAKTDRTK